MWRVAALIGLFYLATIRPGHAWGDDFAQYIHHARNLATGVPYAATGYIYNPYNPTIGPRTYPPGFPLLLAPVVKLLPIPADERAAPAGLLERTWKWTRRHPTGAALIGVTVLAALILAAGGLIVKDWCPGATIVRRLENTTVHLSDIEDIRL